VTYDKSEQTLQKGSSFVTAAQEALDSICSMYMGATDCQRADKCLSQSREHSAEGKGGVGSSVREGVQYSSCTPGSSRIWGAIYRFLHFAVCLCVSTSLRV